MLTTVPINRANRPVSGFTMIELLVTVAVASITLALAVPSFTQMTVNSRLTTQSNEVVAALNLARSEAIKRNVRVSFCRVESEQAEDCELATGPWTHWIVTTGAGGNVIRRGVVNTFSGGISVRSTLTEDLVTFRPEGLAYSGNALVADRRITICAPRNGSGRQVTLGRGSRLSTESIDEDCGA
ncbi:GspH/FimT family pseudopilin [Peristeroidobacter agariperforans]|uniref:GspH/FimT family pseudopilin n=1 Tax=Peristeroidobacter agariperforans TaxID=268404 RepID=UPI0018E5804D|nr:GspH/FimT family pseudopilin [Peristeroidobacter agariperforans]